MTIKWTRWSAIAAIAWAAGPANPQTRDLPPAPEPPVFARIGFPAWYKPVAPFRVIGPIHYVGSEGLAVYFIPTDDGHIVIDGGAPQTAQVVVDGIRELGYDPGDVKILLNTHAHFDHSGGLAALKAFTGAEFLAMAGDRSALEGGFYLGLENRTEFNAPPVKVDRLLEDGEIIELGGVKLVANHTPGHSRGCTSWTLDVEERDEMYSVLVFCSASVAANRLVGRPQYEGIVDDYRRTFARALDWTPDVFLANHPEFFGMADKRDALEAGDALAFVDRDRFPKFIARLADEFERKLAQQQALLEASADE